MGCVEVREYYERRKEGECENVGRGSRLEKR